MYDYRRGESVFAAFVLGGLMGAVLGLLFSPRSGKENREMIAAKTQEYWGEGREFYDVNKAKVMDETEELRAKIDAARERLREQVDSVTEQAKVKVHDITPTAKDVVVKVSESVKTGVETAETKAQDALDRLAEKTAPEVAAAPGATAESVAD